MFELLLLMLFLFLIIRFYCVFIRLVFYLTASSGFICFVKALCNIVKKRPVLIKFSIIIIDNIIR